MFCYLLILFVNLISIQAVEETLTLRIEPPCGGRFYDNEYFEFTNKEVEVRKDIYPKYDINVTVSATAINNNKGYDESTESSFLPIYTNSDIPICDFIGARSIPNSDIDEMFGWTSSCPLKKGTYKIQLPQNARFPLSLSERAAERVETATGFLVRVEFKTDKDYRRYGAEPPTSSYYGMEATRIK